MVTVTYSVLRMLHPMDLTGVSTTTVLVATFFGVYLVFLVPRMFNLKPDRTTLIARALYILAATIVVVPSFGLTIAREFFDFTTPAWTNTWLLFVAIIVVALLQFYIAHKAGQRFRKRQDNEIRLSHGE